MNKAETIFILGIAALLFIGWIITCHLYSLQTDRNKDLQKENTRTIEENLKLQKELNRVNRDLKHALSVLAKKKELLEIQDRLLNENNIKH